MKKVCNNHEGVFLIETSGIRYILISRELHVQKVAF